MGQLFSTAATDVSIASKFATVNNITLHYVEHATGCLQDEQTSYSKKPVLLCLHGASSQAHVFDDFAKDERVIEKFRVFALDLRGHGKSDWAESYLTNDYVSDVDAFVNHLGAQSVTILGMSLGGLVGQSYAGNFPKKVNALISVDIGPGISPEALQKLVSGPPSPATFESLDAAVEFASHSFAWPKVENGILRKDIALRLKKVSKEGDELAKELYTWLADQRIFIGLTTMLEEASWRWQVLANMSFDTLVLRGADSPFVSEDIKSRIESTNTKARVVTIFDAGHCILADNLKGFSDAVVPFLESVAQAKAQ
jgi:esterase